MERGKTAEVTFGFALGREQMKSEKSNPNPSGADQEQRQHWEAVLSLHITKFWVLIKENVSDAYVQTEKDVRDLLLKYL